MKKTWMVLTPRERFSFRLLIILEVFFTVLDLASIGMLVLIIDHYVTNENAFITKQLPAYLSDASSPFLILVFFIFFVVKNFLAGLLVQWQFRLTSQLALRLSGKNFLSTMALPYNNFVASDKSAHIRKVNFIPFDFCQYLLMGMQQLIVQTILVVTALCTLLWVDARLFLVLLAVLLPPVMFVFIRMKKRLLARRASVQYNNEKSLQSLMDALEGFVESGIYQSKDFFLNRFMILRSQFSKNLFDMQALQAIPSRLVESFAILGLLVLILLSSQAGRSDGSLLVTIGAFMAAAYKIIPGLVKIINLGGQMKAHEAIIADFYTGKIVKHEKDKERITSLELRNICFDREGNSVLNNVNLFIKSGELVGISGISGSGKSTLLKIIMGLLIPSSGGVYFNGKRTQLKEILLFQHEMAYTGQESFVFNDSLAANICMTYDEHNHDRLQYAMEFAGLESLPADEISLLNKHIRERGNNVSGGQKQRIALARAVYKDADILILDEPFSQLDDTSENSIMEKLKQLAEKGKMIIIVTHNANALRFCNRVIKLDEKETEHVIAFPGVSVFG